MALEVARPVDRGSGALRARGRESPHRNARSARLAAASSATRLRASSVSARYASHMQLVAGACAAQSPRVALRMRRYVSACARGAP